MLRSPEVTCAEVVEMVRNAPTMSCLVTTPKQASVKIIMNDRGQMCTQGNDGTRMTWDENSGHMVMVQPLTKTVIVMDMKNLPRQADQPVDFIERFKKLEGKSAKDLGETRIDGRSAEKFSATQDGTEYIIWADRRTREPIRMDVTVKMMGQTATVSLRDFKFDVAVPENAFSMDIPAGYTVQRYNVNVPDINKGEQNVVEALRGFALRNEGRFPSKLDDIAPWIKLVKPNDGKVSDSDMQWIMRFELVQHFLGTLPKGDWKYLGAGKTTKDANAVIFWHKTDKGYRAVYGDLRVGNLQAAPSAESK